MRSQEDSQAKRSHKALIGFYIERAFSNANMMKIAILIIFYTLVSNFYKGGFQIVVHPGLSMDSGG